MKIKNLLYAMIVCALLVGMSSIITSSAHANPLISGGILSSNTLEDECDITEEDCDESGWDECDITEEDCDESGDADLGVTSSVERKTLNVKTATKLTVRVKNFDSSVSAKNVEVYIDYDKKLSILKIPDSKFECFNEEDEIRCIIDSLSPGEEVNANFTVKAAKPGKSNIYATVYHDGEDFNESNDESVSFVSVTGKLIKNCVVPKIKKMDYKSIKKIMKSSGCKALLLIKSDKKSKKSFKKMKGSKTIPKAGKSISSKKVVKIYLK